MKTIPGSLAEALVATSGYRAGDTQGYTVVGTEHVRHDDYQSYELLAFRTPDGALYGFEIVRNYGAGEGDSPEPVGVATKADIEVMPLVTFTKSVSTFGFDYDRK